jgi:hypothetical protein
MVGMADGVERFWESPMGGSGALTYGILQSDWPLQRP